MPEVRSRFLMMKTGTSRYSGMTIGRLVPGLNVNPMIAFLTIKRKSVELKHANESGKVHWPNGGHRIIWYSS